MVDPAMADAAEKWYPRRQIYEEVLQVEDPDGMMREWYSQEAEIMSPAVKQYTVIRSLLEKAEKTNDEVAARKAAIMAQELGLLIDQVRAGTLPAGAPTPSGNGQREPIMPLLGQGGKVGGLPANAIASKLQNKGKEKVTGAS